MGTGEVLLSALEFGIRLVLLFLADTTLQSSVAFPLQCPILLRSCDDSSVCYKHSRLLATSRGFCQKTRFRTGAALLISITIDCNYLTSPYIPRGTWREIQCFAKCSFYLCKIPQACSRVLLIWVKPPRSFICICLNELCAFRCWNFKFHLLLLPTTKGFISKTLIRM